MATVGLEGIGWGEARVGQRFAEGKGEGRPAPRLGRDKPAWKPAESKAARAGACLVICRRGA